MSELNSTRCGIAECRCQIRITFSVKHRKMSSEFQEEEEEPPEIKYIDLVEFHNLSIPNDDAEIVFRWIDSFETEEEKWHRLLTKFTTPLAGRNGYCFRIIEKYAKALHYQGAEAVQTKGGLRFLSDAAPRSVGTSGSLPIILKNFSETTREVNLAQYLASALSIIGQDTKEGHVIQKTLSRERLGSVYLFLHGYRQGLENLLANYRLLRNFRYGAKKRKDYLTDHVRNIYLERDSFTQVPEASSLALQMVLEDWNCPLQNEKVVQLAHANTFQMRSLQVKGDGFYFLNEALVCALALNYPDSQEEIEGFDTIFTPHSTNPRGKQLFQFWRMISKYERSRAANPQGFLVTAQRLEEECKSDDIGAGCAVLIETACKIRKQCDQQHEEIAKVINETVTRHPSLGPRMMYLAEKCDVGYENDVFIQQMCDLESRKCLHPSEPTWLLHVERLIQHVGRFGSVRKTMEKSLKIMFEFLDFDSNRFNEKAWLLMEKVLELSDPSFVLPEWRIRCDWWLRYHREKGARDKRKMGENAEKTKIEVLKALEDIVL
ncbi:hypothetical protein CRE_25643 [Caenorhabditis remanei]|uniref:Uncharacterized protein n=1 Tax=Caenorhabditis remanei TaxID=31234 RepID=E3ML69_CAERE|nr:hypothetical protein CRE_25643 [Caenorhabditis remanei]